MRFEEETAVGFKEITPVCNKKLITTFHARPALEMAKANVPKYLLEI
jgi:hypothetical protein